MNKHFTNSIVALMTMGTVLFAPHASANQLDGVEIKSMITGKRVFLATKWGIEFPLTYSRNGKVSGDGTAIGLGQYFAPKETGKWWINGNRMCQQFPTWYNGRTFCFKLESKGGNRFLWIRDDGASGFARLG